jgi:hypothetical protein
MEVPAGAVFALAVDYDHLLILSRLKTRSKFFYTFETTGVESLVKRPQHSFTLLDGLVVGAFEIASAVHLMTFDYLVAPADQNHVDN